MIVDSLRYWVAEMHVDGFRFDLASILSRDSTGHSARQPTGALGHRIRPGAGRHKLIAEAWDAAGLYQVGSFVGDSWKEWNGRFRDDVRDFFRGEPGSLRRLPTAWSAAPKSTATSNARPSKASTSSPVTTASRSTIWSLTTDKHNEANGEENRDGADDNRSWNCGWEGPTDEPEVEKLRNRQVKNFLTVTLLSLGVPMFVMGDEVRRTQSGNNNAYCHDSAASWFDWRLLEKHADVHRFVSLLNARRLLRDVKHEHQRLSLNQMIRQAKKTWHGIRVGQPDWADESHSIAFEAVLEREQLRVYIALNAYWEHLDFELPPIASHASWRRWIDTSIELAARHLPMERGARPVRL